MCATASATRSPIPERLKAVEARLLKALEGESAEPAAACKALARRIAGITRRLERTSP